MMGPMERVTGFEFLIEDAAGARSWVRLQGSGGLMGDGTLATLNFLGAGGRSLESALARVTADCLNRARHELANEGTVRIVTEHADPARRITRIAVRSVLACREVRS